ncbi:MAG: hypothetical protein F6J94_10815 [Moorea sp. SIO1F2]|uniref:hypothetical protein n=1 Tax=Moorena sp. SIO1F2 TaxID=2607819 RepID=UPI0013BDD0A2|nr:hypothetical protein [Moorena sp. SIO1F2]NET82407.1 hypothetical protein [Moorena sp. SIO1F2]
MDFPEFALGQARVFSTKMARSHDRYSSEQHGSNFTNLPQFSCQRQLTSAGSRESGVGSRE